MSEQIASSQLSEDEQARAIQVGFRQARSKFGLARIELGSYLYTMRKNKLFLGMAENWDQFLAQENINPNAARQYANVAEKFIFELNVSEELLSRLALAGITALEKAGRIINERNKEEVLGALTELGEKDAIQRLIEMSSGDEPKPEKATMRVLALLREFNSMPPDLQHEFRTRIEPKAKTFGRDQNR